MPSAFNNSGEPNTAVTRAAPTNESGNPPPVAFGEPIEPGDIGTLGPYRVVHLLGMGGMGAVYAAVDTRLGRRLALKVMLPAFAVDPDAREMFLREARAVAQITHDNVVTIYEADERQGTPYIAMQFLEGAPLDAYLARHGRMSLPRILRIAWETAVGLDAAHRIGLVHRDIKPGNLWLEAPHGRVKVLDFGLARPVTPERELTVAGTVVGTPAYMSPEQAQALKVDHRTDLFSLGAVLYLLCTGRLPFDGETPMAILYNLATREPTPVRELNPAVPEAFAALIHQLLAKEANRRPASAAEVAEQVRVIAEGNATAEPFSTARRDDLFVELDRTLADVPARRSENGTSRLWWIVSGSVVLLLLMVCVGWVILQGKDSPSTVTVVPEETRPVEPQLSKPAVAAEPDWQNPAVVARWLLDQKKLNTVTIEQDGRYIRVDTTARFAAGPVLVRKLDFHPINGGKIAPEDIPRLAAFSDLTFLNLARQPLTDETLAKLLPLKELRQLDVKITRITPASARLIRQLPKLERIEGLNDEEWLGTLAGMPTIRFMHVYDWRPVPDRVMERFADYPNLSELMLMRSWVSNDGLRKLKAVKTLRTLRLDRDQVRLELARELAEAMPWCEIHLAGTGEPESKMLKLNEGRATPDRMAAEWTLSLGGEVRVNGQDAAVTAVADLPKERFTLTGVRLAGKAIDDVDLDHLEKAAGVTHLDLSGTRVGDGGLGRLRTLNKSLKVLNVRKTAVTAKGLADFRREVPGCKVEAD